MLRKPINMAQETLWKIITNALRIRWVKKWYERITKRYEMERIEIENDMLDRKEKARALDFRHYLPDTEERIEQLRRVINKRPVAIILHGPSAKELEERIGELKDCDICYFGVNAFSIPEEHILQKINRNFSVVMYTAIRSGAESLMGDVIDFLERKEDNILISARDSFRPLEVREGFDLDKFIKKYDKRLLFITVAPFTYIMIWHNLFLQVPGIEYPLHFPPQGSFSILLSLALIGEAPMVVIFGGDGGRINNRELYFRETGAGDTESFAEEVLAKDTELFNITMPVILEKIYKVYNLRPVDIVNCSVNSNYTPLRKLSYDDTFALLRSFKKRVG